MGSGGSKPEGQHVFNADTPVRFSQNVVDSLQNSAETDSSRAQDTELKIQARVNSELKRLRDEQSKQITDLLSKTNTPASSSDSSPKQERDPNTLFAHLSSPFYHDSSSNPSTSDSTSNQQNKKNADRTHDSVQSEIATLRKKLDERKKLDKPSKEVEKAKEKLVQCLRINDRRPLDCWEEVEGFKAEVAKLERAFVEKAGR